MVSLVFLIGKCLLIVSFLLILVCTLISYQYCVDMDIEYGNFSKDKFMGGYIVEIIRINYHFGYPKMHLMSI